MSKSERIFWLNDNDDEDLPEFEFITVRRVCLQQLWTEALGKRDVIDERSAAVIKSIMTSFEDWKEEPNQRRYGIYGRFRNGYIRKDMLNNSEEEENYCVSVAGKSSQNDVTEFDLF